MRVLDSETLALDDGSEVRLLGALAPRSPDPQASGWLPELEARAALERLVAGRSIELAFGGQRTDRYGRMLAHGFIEQDGERVWVQGWLLSHGHARAYALTPRDRCASELLAHEALARESRLGLWSNAAYRALPARRTYELMRRRGTFQIVDGIVAKVSVVRGRTYVNFGSDWRTDFSIGIASAVARGTPLAASLKAMEGRRIRVRGWIERRNGPFIELQHSALLEVLDGNAPTGAPDTGAPSALSPPAATGDDNQDHQQDHQSERPARRVPGAIDL